LSEEKKKKTLVDGDVIQKGYTPEKITEVRTANLGQEKSKLQEGYNPKGIVTARASPAEFPAGYNPEGVTNARDKKKIEKDK